jgi:GT2 family glycosyltransferase
MLSGDAPVSPPTVSVVVCTYTRARASELLDALRSLREQSVCPGEVIVVVDHNRALLEVVRAEAPDVIAVENDAAPGLAGARNSGVRVARGEVVAFLDDDALAAPDWIERLAAAYRDPRVLGAGGAVLPVFDGRRPRWMPAEFDWVVGCSYRGQPADRSPVRNLIGANMSFRREALEHVEGFAGGLGRVGADRLGCEETDLCIRLGQEFPDGIIVYDPATRVGHRVGRERTRVGYFVARCHAEGLSKAEVARRCGRRLALESERSYARRALPAGVRDGFAAFLRGELAGLARASAIVLGLTATVAGYAAGARPGTRTR